MDAICATLPRVAAERCPDMEDMVQLVANKYGRALMLYSKCHELFNSSDRFSEEMLASLRKFPNLTILLLIVLTVVIKSYILKLIIHCTCTRQLVIFLCSSQSWILMSSLLTTVLHSPLPPSLPNFTWLRTTSLIFYDNGRLE